MELKTTSIKGKDYVQVNERVRAFRTHPDFAGFAIETEVIKMGEAGLVMVCRIKDADDRTIATGHAEEIQSQSGVNSTSWVENCETSAVGRALGFLGIGVDNFIATSEEVEGAINRQADSGPSTDTRSPKKTEVVKETPTTAPTEKNIDWKQVVCPVGKFKGKLMGEIFQNDAQYLSWMVKNIDAKTEDFKFALEQSARELNDNGNQGFAKAG